MTKFTIEYVKTKCTLCGDCIVSNSFDHGTFHYLNSVLDLIQVKKMHLLVFEHL